MNENKIIAAILILQWPQAPENCATRSQKWHRELAQSHQDYE
jgi:hypothetical protein